MPQASHVQLHSPKWSHPLDHGFMYDLSSLADLTEYWLEVRGGHIRDGFADYLQSREWEHANGGSGVQSHVHTREGRVLSVLVDVEQGKEERRSMVKVFIDFQDKVHQGMLEAINRSGTIFVNENGGYFELSESVKVLATVELKNWILPGDPRVRLLQWQDGGHYYAKVGNEDVVLYGKQKWDTKEEAQDAAKKWLLSNAQ